MFYTRYKDHIQVMKNNNNGSSGHSNHTLNTGRACGSTIDTMKVTKIAYSIGL
jgi:hypothetical protein